MCAVRWEWRSCPSTLRWKSKVRSSSMVEHVPKATRSTSGFLRAFASRGAVALAGALLSTLVVAAELTADMVTDEPIINPKTMHHSLRIGSETIRYAATYAETLLS